MPRLIFPNQTRFIPTGSTYDRMQWPFIKNVMEEVVLQGGLLSPYLLILGMDKLFHLILKEVNNGI